MNEHLPKHHKVLPWLISIGAVVLIGLVMFFIWFAGQPRGSEDKANEGTKSTSSTNTPSTSQQQNTASSTPEILWSFSGTEWKYLAQGAKPPTCDPQIIEQSPANVSSATAILYPGQVRGGNYKAHGGFLFGKATTNKIDVVAPLDAVAYRGTRYKEMGEVQYMFDFIAPCGIMYRLDHLRTLTPKFQAIAETFPAAGDMTSGTNIISPAFEVKTGEKIATEVGFNGSFRNVSFDFGVYDLRKKNVASQSSSFVNKQGVTAELGQYAVCWLDLLPGTDAAKVQALPGGDQASGKTSDYCK